MQLISFIDSSSGVNTAAGVNRNIYYVTSFSNTVRGSTGLFLSNSDRQVSRLVAQQLTYRSGSISLTAGINDLATQYATLAVSIPGVAIIVAAGSSSRSAAVTATNRLRSSYSGGLSVVCVPLGSTTNVATLTAIAGSGLNGSPLVYRTQQFGRISTLLGTAVSELGTFLLYQRSTRAHNNKGPAFSLVFI